jgi:Ureidoglycolate lyase
VWGRLQRAPAPLHSGPIRGGAFRLPGVQPEQLDDVFSFALLATCSRHPSSRAVLYLPMPFPVVVTRPSPLALVHRMPSQLPVEGSTMGRHRWSSQKFLPLDAGRWLIVVAPHAFGPGRPDMDQARAFSATGTQGVTYGADVWHHPFTVLDRPARFAVSMWRQGDAEDEGVRAGRPLSVSGRPDQRWSKAYELGRGILPIR